MPSVAEIPTKLICNPSGDNTNKLTHITTHQRYSEQPTGPLRGLWTIGPSFPLLGAPRSPELQTKRDDFDLGQAATCVVSASILTGDMRIVSARGLTLARSC